MSLNIYLMGEEKDVNCICECGNEHTKKSREYFYDANITHNLGEMADKAGIYQCLWRSEEINISKANQLVNPLREGLLKMKKDPSFYKKFDAPNGWGTYNDFVPWVENLLKACLEYPDASIGISR